MALHTDIHDQLKDAMKAKDAVRLRTIRNMLTMFVNELVATGKKPQEILGDEEVLTGYQAARRCTPRMVIVFNSMRYFLYSGHVCETSDQNRGE